MIRRAMRRQAKEEQQRKQICLVNQDHHQNVPRCELKRRTSNGRQIVMNANITTALLLLAISNLMNQQVLASIKQQDNGSNNKARQPKTGWPLEELHKQLEIYELQIDDDPLLALASKPTESHRPTVALKTTSLDTTTSDALRQQRRTTEQQRRQKLAIKNETSLIVVDKTPLDSSNSWPVVLDSIHRGQLGGPARQLLNELKVDANSLTSTRINPRASTIRTDVIRPKQPLITINGQSEAVLFAPGGQFMQPTGASYQVAAKLADRTSSNSVALTTSQRQLVNQPASNLPLDVAAAAAAVGQQHENGHSMQVNRKHADGGLQVAQSAKSPPVYKSAPKHVSELAEVKLPGKSDKLLATAEVEYQRGTEAKKTSDLSAAAGHHAGKKRKRKRKKHKEIIYHVEYHPKKKPKKKKVHSIEYKPNMADGASHNYDHGKYYE